MVTKENILIKNNVVPYGWGVRHVQIVCMFLCFTVAYMIRTSMSVAIIALADHNNTREGVQTFNWTKQKQDLVQGSFFWGYTLMQIPVGHLSYMYGGKRFIAFGLIANGFLSFAIPSAARYGGWLMVCVCRGLQGLSQGGILPAIHTLLGKWAPVTERNRMGNMVYLGGNVGTIIALPLAGYICAGSLAWPGVFGVIGAISLCMGTLWALVGAEAPAEHSSITREEKLFIQTSLGQTEARKTGPAPWLSFLKSGPVWALLVGHVGSAWGFYFLLTQTPSFIKMALGENIEQSGVLGAVSYTLGFCVMTCTSWLADFVVSRSIMSVTTVRKLANTIGTWGPACGLLILTWIPVQHIGWATITILITVGLDSASCTGFMMNHIDLSPNFAGLLMGVTNSIATLLINLSPFITGYFVQDPTDITQWHHVFLITAAVYSLTNLIFVLFGTGEKQPWNSVEITAEKLENATDDKIDHNTSPLIHNDQQKN